MNFKLALVGLCSAVFLSGCVAGTQNVALNTPQYTNDKTASGSIFIAEIVDNRVFEDQPKSPSTPSVDGDLASTSPETLATLIGRMRNGYGKAMGSIATEAGRTIQDEVRELLTAALQGRGYSVVNDASAASATLGVRVDKFWSWFQPGAFTFDVDAEISCNLLYSDAGGQQSFDVSGRGNNTGAGRIGANVALTYERAYSDFLANLDAAMDGVGL